MSENSIFKTIKGRKQLFQLMSFNASTSFKKIKWKIEKEILFSWMFDTREWNWLKTEVLLSRNWKWQLFKLQCEVKQLGHWYINFFTETNVKCIFRFFLDLIIFFLPNTGELYQKLVQCLPHIWSIRGGATHFWSDSLRILILLWLATSQHWCWRSV